MKNNLEAQDIMNRFHGVCLKENDFLVTPLPDYYKEKKEGFNSKKDLSKGLSVGVIEHVGMNIPKECIGDIIYYQSSTQTEVNLLSIGEFDIVKQDYMILIRDDQDANNY